MKENELIIDVPIDAIVFGKRLRTTNQEKVIELSNSFQDIGIINPISIDEKWKLIAGAHRIAAAKLCGWKTIRAIIFDENEILNAIRECDENLFVNSLDFISQGENIERREELLSSLGKRATRGNSAAGSVLTTDALAEKLGVSNRVYRLRRQVATLTPVVRDALRGTRHGDNLVELVLLSRLEDEVQERVAELVSTDTSNRSLKLIVNQAKVDIHTNEDRFETVRYIKSKFGVPNSAMKFNKEDSVLQGMVTDIASTCNGDRQGNFNGGILGNYVGFCIQSLFLLDYFVRTENPRILDNFIGNGVNIITALFLGFDVIGFDLDPKKVDTINDACDKNFDKNKFQLFNEDGIAMKPLMEKYEYLDGILTDPPYLNGVDSYTESEEDLSNMSQEKFLSQMEECFNNYYRLIKTSNVDEKRFYPVMMKMNYSRQGKKGVISMDFLINDIATKAGFTLWDRTINLLNSPLAAVNIPRVAENHYTIKNWETTLIWIKQ